MFEAAERTTKAFAYLGEHGWELVGMHDKTSNWIGQLERGFVLFKREVPEGNEPDGPWAEWVQADAFGETKAPRWRAW